MELPADRRQVMPDRLSDDPAVPNLEEPEHPVADPSPSATDIERAAGDPTLPRVLVDDEVRAVLAPDGNVALVDDRGQPFPVPASNRVAAQDGALGGADDVVHDRIGHQSEEAFEIGVMLGTQLAVDDPIELRSGIVIGLRLGRHAAHHVPGH